MLLNQSPETSVLLEQFNDNSPANFIKAFRTQVVNVQHTIYNAINLTIKTTALLSISVHIFPFSATLLGIRKLLPNYSK